MNKLSDDECNIDEKFINKIVSSVKEMDITKMIKILNETIDKLIEDEIDRNIKNDDEKIILKNVVEGYKIFLELVEREYFVEAYSVLRSIFEEILMYMAISVDEELYNIFLKIEKTKIEFSKIKPQSIRKIISNEFNKFLKLDYVDWQKSFDDYYEFLCCVVHPTVLRNYFYGISNSKYGKENIKIIIRTNSLYCKYILLIFLENKIDNKNLEDYYNLFTIHQLLEITTMHEKNDIKKIWNENEKYLHMEVNNELKENLNNSNNQIEEFDYNTFKECLKLMYLEYYIKLFGMNDLPK